MENKENNKELVIPFNDSDITLNSDELIYNDDEYEVF